MTEFIEFCHLLLTIYKLVFFIAAKINAGQSLFSVIVNPGMQELLTFLSQHQGIEFYSILTLALIASGCYFPVSSDLTIIAVTALSAAKGLYDLPTVFVCVLVGILTGDLINFTVAKKYGPKVLKNNQVKKVLKPERIEKAKASLLQFGEKYILFIRFMPLVRTILYFAAGLLQIPTWKFLLYNTISTTLYLVIFMSLSYKVGTDIDKLHASIFKFEVGFALVIFVLIGVAFYLKKSRKRS